jgi:ribokinase
MVGLFDYVVLSEEDGEEVDSQAEAWSRRGVGAVVTRAERGCSLFEAGVRRDFGAYTVDEIVDPVGAGDVFAVALLYALLEGEAVEAACDFANAAGAVSLSMHAGEMNFGAGRVRSFAASFGRE